MFRQLSIPLWNQSMAFQVIAKYYLGDLMAQQFSEFLEFL